jgi:hypothetical protein
MPNTLAATSPEAKDFAPAIVGGTDKTDSHSLLHKEFFDEENLRQSAWSSNSLLVSAWEQRSTSLVRHSDLGATQLRNKKVLKSEDDSEDRCKDMLVQSQHRSTESCALVSDPDPPSGII